MLKRLLPLAIGIAMLTTILARVLVVGITALASPVGMPPSSMSTCTGPTNGLVLYYSFDNSDISGSTVTDLSTSGYNGTLSGSPTTGVTGQCQQAINFSSSSQYVTVGASQIAYNNSNYTVCLWINPSSLPGTNGGYVYEENNTGGPILDINETNNGTINFGNWNSSFVYAESTATISNNVWTHVCGVYSTTAGNLSVYIAGSQNGSQPGTNGFSGSASSVLINKCGGTACGGGSFNFLGSIDELRVYNRALSSSEIAALASQHSP